MDLPKNLHTAYAWTDAAGEISELATLSGEALRAYIAASVANFASEAIKSEWPDGLTESDLDALAEWLRVARAMDPTTALAQLVSALDAGNVPAAAAAAKALRGWHEGGGFLPRWPEGAPACPTGLGAFHLGRLVAAMDLSGAGGDVARHDYSRALAAIETLLREAPGAWQRWDVR
jgi:hypothetical protein